MREPFITVRALQPVTAALDALGYRSQTLLTDSGIAPSTLREVDGRVPQSRVMLLWQRAVAASRDEQLGLHLAQSAPLESFEVHCYALLGSLTLRDAYRRACRYQRLIHETTLLELVDDDAQAILRHSLPDGRSVPCHPAEFLVALWVRFGRLIAGNDWSPRLIRFAHKAPEDLSEHQRLFRCPLRFESGSTAMHVANDVLDAPNLRADPALVGMLDRYADALLERMPARNTLGGQVRAWLLAELVAGEPTAGAAAKALNMSVRSLHRALSEEDTSFRGLLELLRRERAASLLGNPRYSIGEVAFLLGFSELSSFYRAFKRWNGMTPAAFRAEAFVLGSDTPSLNRS